MFLEKMGRLVFAKIGMIPFLIVLSLGPICAGFFLYLEKQSVNLFVQQFQTGKAKVRTAVARKERKEKFLERHANSDPYFLETKIEGLTFLEEEKNGLKRWVEHPGISDKEPLLQRIRFLENGGNRLAFREEDMQLSKLYKETVEKQQNQIEVDERDLKKLLGLIEHSDLANCPQLIVSEFSLHKKQTALQKEILEIKMDLFKREFLSP